MSFSRLMLSAALVFPMLASVPSAHAGMHIEEEVVINSTYARGALGTVRNSADSMQYIGCNLYSTPSSKGRVAAVECYAQDVNGNQAYCSTTDSVLIGIARSLNGDDVLQFSTGSTGECTDIGILKNSRYAPQVGTSAPPARSGQ